MENTTFLAEICVGKMLNVQSHSALNGEMAQLTKKFTKTVGIPRHFVPVQASNEFFSSF